MRDDKKKSDDHFEDEFDFDEESFNEENLEENLEENNLTENQALKSDDLENLDNNDLNLDDLDPDGLEPVKDKKNTFNASETNQTIKKSVGSKTPIPLIISVLVVSFLGWKGYHWLKPSPSQSPTVLEQPTAAAILPAEPKKITSDKLMAEIPAAPAQQDTAAGAPWLAQETVPVPESDVEKLVKKLESQEEGVNKRIKTVEDNLAELIETVAVTGKNVSQIGLVVDDLTKTIDTLTKEVVSLKEETLRSRRPLEQLPRQAKELPTPPRQVVIENNKPKLDIQALGSPKTAEELARSSAYAFATPPVTVHAIIPGRAWLKAKEGRIITVTEGDYVEGYGKVVGIDANAGVVITSSGLTLK